MTNPPVVAKKKDSHKASITGSILALVSLITAGLANWVVHAQYTPKGPTSGTVEREVGHAIATGTTTVLGTLFGGFFSAFAIVFALLALVFIALRLRKVKLGGLLFSVAAVCLAIWSIAISVGVFNLIKAD